ncbi:MAG: CRISPR-associated endonuclease Cas1 [Terriglobales bacterium]|jgi:CRISPR-associated endonuclease Cas1
MAAAKNVYQLPQSHNSVPRHGVLTLFGYGIQVRVDRGHLVVEDGIGAERYYYRLPRVGHGLKRLVVIGSDGLVSLAALRWLRDQDAAFVLLERNGKVLCVTGPVGSSDAKLRRAQGLAVSNGMGLEICRRLIDAKLQGQEHVLRERLNCQLTADTVAGFRNKLGSAENFDAIRNLEANAASAYFREWRDLPVTWPKADLQKIPVHWRSVGSRQSPLSGGPRLAVTPVHAILNYCFALLEAETRLALSALGMDLGLGVGLHTDTANRDSLALDVLEPVRPQVEMWLLDWVAREPLRRADFFETATGNCRLMSQICTKLSGTAPVWRKLVAPWAEFVAHTIWAGTSKSKGSRLLSTPLTQQHRRVAKGRPALPEVKTPKPERLCRGCGKTVQGKSMNCAECDVEIATKRLVEAARAGRVAGHTPEAIAKQTATHRKHVQAQAAWNPAKQPAWLTEQVFLEKIQPALARTSATAIAKRIGVSRWYAGRIREGYRPHPRHWVALAKMVGIGM